MLEQVQIVKEGVKVLLYLFLVILVITATRDAHELSEQSKLTMVNLDRRVSDTSQNVNAALIQLGLATDEVRRASIEQRRYWSDTAKETTRTIASVRSLVERTDVELNERILPETNALLVRTNGTLEEIRPRMVDLLDQGTRATSDLDVGVLLLNKRLGDPKIDGALGNMVMASGNVAVATGALAEASKDVRERVHQATRPASFAVRVGSTLLGIGAKVGSILAGAR